MANDKFTAQQMIDALAATNGMTTLAARRLGCSATTVRRYIKEYPTVKDAKFEAHETLGDAVESTLFNEAVKERNVTALIFLAKTKFKDRGYVERSEHVLLGITPELERQFKAAADAAGITPGEALEAFVQELAHAQLTAGGEERGAEGGQ